jgi:hypothetical protein
MLWHDGVFLSRGMGRHALVRPWAWRPGLILAVVKTTVQAVQQWRARRRNWLASASLRLRLPEPLC